MDKVAFIAEIRKREFLWKRNRTQLQKNSKEKFEELWEEIGNLFGVSADLAKRRWRMLRDQFYKILIMKRVPVYTTGDTFYIEEKDKPNWQYFNDLTFVLNNYKPKENIVKISNNPASEVGNTTIEESTFPSITHEQDEDSVYSEIEIKEEELEKIYQEEIRDPFVDVPPPLALVKPQQPVQPFTSIKRIYTLEKTDNLDLPIPMDEQIGCPTKKRALESNVTQNIQAGANTEPVDDNENFVFLRSLLPFMRKLDPVQQLRVRMRFQEALLEKLGNKRRN